MARRPCAPRSARGIGVVVLAPDQTFDALRHVLNISSGLYPVDNEGLEYATGAGLAYWAGASSIEGMRNRGLVREPGTYWDYENNDTLLAVYATKRVLGEEEYRTYPRKALLDRIGMRNTLVGTDRFGDFILRRIGEIIGLG